MDTTLTCGVEILSLFILMQINCTGEEKELFAKVAKAAEQLAVDAYLIGGFVRDKILGRETKDADIVCIGDGIALAKATAQQFRPVPSVQYFKNFGTAHIRIPLQRKGAQHEPEWFDLEFVGARKESYRAESRKPDVEAGSFKDD